MDTLRIEYNYTYVCCSSIILFYPFPLYCSLEDFVLSSFKLRIAYVYLREHVKPSDSLNWLFPGAMTPELFRTAR